MALIFAGAVAAQNTVLHIAVTSGEGAVYAAGSHAAKPLTIQVTDETGRPVEGARVSFQAPQEGPGGAFPNGLRTDLAVTDANGRATLRALQLNRTTGPFSVRITAAKDQARAGIVAKQYIGDVKQPTEATSVAPTKEQKPTAFAAAAAPTKEPPAAAKAAPAPAAKPSAELTGIETQTRSRSAGVMVAPSKKPPQPVILKEASVGPAQPPNRARDLTASDAGARPRSGPVPTIIITPRASRSAQSTVSDGHKSHKKWLWMGILAAGGAAGGYFGSGMGAAATHGSVNAAGATPATVGIGAPTVSIGKP